MSFVLCSKKFEDMAFAAAASRSIGRPLVTESQISAAVKAFNPENLSGAMFISIDESSDLDELSTQLKNIELRKLHFLVSPSASNLGRQIFEKKIAGNVVFARFQDPDSDGGQYSRIIKAQSAGPFPSLRHLLPTANIHTFDLQDWLEREQITDSVMHQLECIGCTDRVATAVSSSVDELLIHAFGGAVSKSKNADNLSDIVQIQLGSENDYFGVSVCGNFPSTDPSAVFRDVSGALESNTDVRIERLTGFGLSLALILRSGASIRYFCKAGKFAEVTILFQRANRLLDFRKQFQFVATHFLNVL